MEIAAGRLAGSCLPHKDDGELQRTLEEILLERNQDFIEIQRGNYNLLLEMIHELMEQEEQEQLQEDSITLEMDPLTALVQERDAQAQRLHDLDLKTTSTSKARGIAECDSDRGDTYSVSHVTDMHITMDMHTTRVH